MYRQLYQIVLLFSALLLSGCDFSEIFLKQNPSYKIGFSQAMSDDLWRQTMNSEMRRVASIYPELELLIRDGNTNNEKQIQDIEYFLEQGVDILIVSPNESEPLRPVIEKAYESGIPVILIDRRINSDKYTTYISADNYSIGQQAAIYAKQLLGGNGKILEISGLQGSSPAQARHQGFIDQFDEAENYTIIDGGDGGWVKSKTKKVILDDFEKHGSFDLIFGHNDVTTLGAYEVAKEFGSEDSTFFIGVDALPGDSGGVKNVLDGIFTASLIYPTGAKEAIITANQILSGEKVPKTILLNTSIVDKDNAEIYMLQSEKLIEQQQLIENQQSILDNQILRYENQQSYLLILIVGFLILFAVSFFLYRAYRTINLININLERKNRSISRQKDEILQMSRRIKDYNDQKIEFFTFISHEFRTPIAVILTVLYKVKNVSKSISSNQIKILDQNVKRLNLLVDQILDFRQIEEEKIEINATPCDLGEFIPKLIRSFSEIEDKAFTFSIDHSGSTIVLLDEDKLEKILTNLISNAIKFTSQNGKIDIEANISSNELTLKVKDNGKGIPKNEYEEVFKPFFSSKSGGTKYYSKGTGIGLNLVKKLVDLSGGTIKVESQEGKGTTFECMLPTEVLFVEEDSGEERKITDQIKQLPDKGPSTETKEQLDRLASSGSRTHKVLLVEDNKQLNNELVDLFSEHEYDVYTAFDGEDGIQKAINISPDIVITDILMPGKSGYEVASFIKKDSKLNNTIVLILSALTTIDVKKKGYEAGVDDYMTKPFSPELLIAKVQNMLTTRDKIKEEVTDNESLWLSMKTEQLTDNEADFVTSLKVVLEKYCFDPGFNVTSLAENMNMSRVSLYNKIKNVSEYSPVELIKAYRLYIAKNLIIETNLSIAEIGYKVGFQSASYFSKTYKEFFNISPKDYALQNHQAPII